MAWPEPIDRRSKTALVAGRRRARRPALLTGTLVFGDGALTLDCTIRNHSDAGARVRAAAPYAGPAELHLMHMRAGVAYEARVAWRRGAELGLEFVGKFDLADAPVTPEQRVMRRLWLETLPRTIASL